MTDLLPFLRLYRQHWLSLSLGLLLALVTLVAGMGLLSLSGWFLSAAAVAGMAVASRDTFNYMTPAGGVRFFSIIRTAGRWGERVVSHDATFRVLTRLRVWFWQKLSPLSTGALAGFRQADLLNRLVADIDAMDHVYLRLVTPIGAALLSSAGLVFFLSLFDAELALILGAILLFGMLALPLVFYFLGRQPGRQLIAEKSNLRTRLVDYLDGKAELQMFAAAPRARAGPSAHRREVQPAYPHGGLSGRPGRTADVRRRSRGAHRIAAGGAGPDPGPGPHGPRQRPGRLLGAVAERLDSDPDALAGRSRRRWQCP